MARAPYMNFPFPLYRNYYKPSYYNHDFSKTNQNPSHLVHPEQITSTPMESYNVEEKHYQLKEKNKSNKYNDDYLFDLFGLKIYNDDVLIVSLIYFLYSEGVKDDSLFLVLILLLLS